MPPLIDPLWILAIGIATVLGMILVLKINAFISLTTAAMLVSLLAGGNVAEKISRVAGAFGSGAGAIGIVIALAAVIGKCMMDSGAADRVVRTFLSLLGVKRASFALMGSGFILAVPVFFDTVFYLLVPLARSLYRKTNRNYLMYILAIAAGGAITHTLVPPTPGPLVMSATLGIDVGYMILIGLIVAFPAALVGILFARLADRLMHVPMRSPGVEPEPLADEELPSLFLSLLPVILPVAMISTNTVMSTLADREGSQYFREADIRDYEQLSRELVAPIPGTPADRWRMFLSEEMQQRLELGPPATPEARRDLLDELNRSLSRRIDAARSGSAPTGSLFLYDDAAFESIVLPAWRIQQLKASDPPLSESQKEALGRQELLATWAARDRSAMKPNERERFHRIALDAAFPDLLQAHQWETPLRKAANVSALLGDANLALLLSTAVALYVLWNRRRPSLTQLASTVEESLMSGGAIILITAAGFAFGRMLTEAQVGKSMEALFPAQSNGSGLLYLFMGFGLASLLKIAQGSSTTAMIVGSGMLAPIVASTDLGFHPVYLATAIGAGSLVGSWMNDSGFWIFAKMSGLTEAEALKSWTPMLIVLGLTSLMITVLLTFVMPLT